VYQVHEKLFLGGTWTSPSSSRTIEVISASTAEPIGKVPEAGEDDVDIAVESARRAFDDPKGWASWEPQERAVTLERFAVALQERSDEFDQLVSSQNGMPLAFGGVKGSGIGRELGPDGLTNNQVVKSIYLET
jgi:aldehyde dehydrogenase (NAD+)